MFVSSKYFCKYANLSSLNIVFYRNQRFSPNSDRLKGCLSIMMVKRLTLNSEDFILTALLPVSLMITTISVGRLPPN